MKRRLAAAMLLASLAVVGLEARYGNVSVPTPAEVRAAYRPSDALVLDRRGEPLHQVRVDATIRRLAWTPIGEVSPALIESVVRAEDRRFHEHGGVDARAFAASIAGALRGRPLRGASTITMQLARRLGTGTTGGARRAVPHGLRAKLWQIRAARALEASWTKPEILEAYLNLVTFRGEIQGVGAASRLLFGKSPQGLDRDEAAVLTALLRAPNAEPAAVAHRASALAGDGADLAPIVARALDGTRRASGFDADDAPHVARRLGDRLTPGAAVTTTLDARVQRLADAVLRRQILDVRDRRVNDGAILVVDNATGDVLAYVGGSGSLSSARHVDGVRAVRQAGSALKPFLYALALDRRVLTPATLLDDAPLELPQPNGVYRPENYDRRFRGLVSVRTALASSLNVPAVRTAMLVGVDPFVSLLRTLGFSQVREDGDFYGPAIALGSVEVSLWEMVGAYRALARGGRFEPLRLTADAPGTAARDVLSPEAAFLVGDILSDRASRSATFGLESPLATPFWSAVKTGTSKDMRDNWCVGFTRRYTVGVWVGNFSGEPMEDVTGITGAAPAWLEMIGALERESPGLRPEPPAGVVSAPVRFAANAEPARREWFLAGSEPATEPAVVLARRARILAPVSGSILARDPDIPSERQRVAFEAEATAPGDAWRLDGHPLGSAREVALWEPRSGRHVLELIDRGGSAVDEVRFLVRP